MDETTPTLSAPAPAAPGGVYPPPSNFGHRAAERAPGRPADDPARREASDRAYQANKEFESMLPAKAKESRLLVYRLNPRTMVKQSTSAIGHLLANELKELGLAENGTALTNWLMEKFGQGLYRIEPSDEHGRRIDKLASWTEHVTDPENPMPDETAPAERRQFGNRRRDEQGDGEDEDDERGGKLDMADMMEQFNVTRRDEAQTAAKSGASMIEMMMMQTKEQARIDENRRRDDREAADKEERRREEARKLDEEKRRTERKDEEDRRREERKEEENRRREDRDRDAKTAADRLALITAAITAGAGIIAKLMEPKPKDDTTLALVLKTLDSRKGDDVTGMLLKNMMEQNNSKILIEQLSTGSQMAAKMQGQVFETAMKSSLEMQQQMHARAMDQANNAAQGGGTTLDKVVDIASKAGAILQNLVPAGGAPQAALPAPNAPQQPAQPMVAPTGVEAVVRSMITLQTGRTTTGQPLTQEQKGQVVNFMVEEMPDDLFDAILNDDQEAIQRISQPIILANPQYIAWISRAGTVDWVTKFFSDLRPELAKLEQAQPAPAASAATPQQAAPAAQKPPQQAAAAAGANGSTIAGPGAVSDDDSPV